MRKGTLTLMLISMLILITLPSAQAEHEWFHRYTLSGTVTDSAGDVARGVAGAIDCSEGKTPEDVCGLNEGRSATTGSSGKYELALHLHSSDHGKTIIIKVEGDEFNHTLDLEGADGEMEEEDRFVGMDIQLSFEVSSWSYYLPFIIIAIIVLFTFLIVIKKKNLLFFKERSDAASINGKRTDLLKCPKCDAELKEYNLVKHLKSQHYMKQEKAEEAVSELNT